MGCVSLRVMPPTPAPAPEPDPVPEPASAPASPPEPSPSPASPPSPAPASDPDPDPEPEPAPGSFECNCCLSFFGDPDDRRECRAANKCSFVMCATCAQKWGVRRPCPQCRRKPVNPWPVPTPRRIAEAPVRVQVPVPPQPARAPAPRPRPPRWEREVVVHPEVAHGRASTTQYRVDESTGLFVRVI